MQLILVLNLSLKKNAKKILTRIKFLLNLGFEPIFLIHFVIFLFNFKNFNNKNTHLKKTWENIRKSKNSSPLIKIYTLKFPSSFSNFRTYFEMRKFSHEMINFSLSHVVEEDTKKSHNFS